MPLRIHCSLLLLPSTSRLPPFHAAWLASSPPSCLNAAEKARRLHGSCSRDDRTAISSASISSGPSLFPIPTSRLLPRHHRSWRRAFAHLANKEPELRNTTKQPTAEKKEEIVALAKNNKAPVDDATPTGLKSKAGGKEQRLQDIQIVKRLLPNIWPKGDTGTKARVLVAIGLLVGGKLLNVQVPFYFKSIVDSLNIPIAELSAEQTAWTIGGAAIVGCEQGLRRASLLG